MTVRDLIDALEEFPEDMEVRIGMIQRYGSNFALSICENGEVHKIKAWYEKDYKAVVITEGSQIGIVDYDDEDDDEWDEEDEDWEED